MAIRARGRTLIQIPIVEYLALGLVLCFTNIHFILQNLQYLNPQMALIVPRVISDFPLLIASGTALRNN
jgi:hypothetical protein